MTKRREANLDNLASELFLLIASQIPDLLSLDSLLRASPAFFRLFEKNAVEITEAVLSFGNTHRHIQVIVRIVALIRSSNVPAPNLTYFKNRATEHAMHNRLISSRDAIAPLFLAKDTTPKVLRQIFATNRKITSLVLHCLSFYLARFQTLRPDHPVDENFAPAGYKNTQNVQGKRFLAEKSGSPDWVEEQRVTRAFWRIQLVYDLKQAATSLSWPEDDITILHKMHPMQMYQDVAIRQGRFGEAEVHPEYQEICSVFDYIHEAHGENAKRASAFKSTTLVHGEVCRQWPAAVPGKDSWKALTNASEACQFLYHIYRNCGKTIVQFEWFRHWGFAFWSSRMVGAGFLQDRRILRPNARNNDPVYMFAWESILPVGDPSIFRGGDFRLPSTAATPVI